MAEAVHTMLPGTDKSTSRRLAFGVFAAPTAWVLHGTFGVAIVGRDCYGTSLAGWQWTSLAVVTILAAALALAGGVTAYRVFRNWTHGARITRAEGWDRIEFVSLAGILTSALLLLNIVYFGILPFVVNPCVTAT